MGTPSPSRMRADKLVDPAPLFPRPELDGIGVRLADRRRRRPRRRPGSSSPRRSGLIRRATRPASSPRSMPPGSRTATPATSRNLRERQTSSAAAEAVARLHLREMSRRRDAHDISTDSADPKAHCADCHLDHGGKMKSLTALADPNCARCHADLASHATDTSARADGHQFLHGPSRVQEAGEARRAASSSSATRCT